MKTKVFAGGAFIAEQTVFNQVAWITADQVTGSSIKLHKTGVFYDTDRKEYEPLGQEVLPSEPALDDQDVGAAIARPFIADESQSGNADNLLRQCLILLEF